MNLQITNLSVQMPNEWNKGHVSASFQQRIQGGRLNFSGSLNVEMNEIENFKNLTIDGISDAVLVMVLDKIENGEIIPEESNPME